jgi:molecular chaperone GrpE
MAFCPDEPIETEQPVLTTDGENMQPEGERKNTNSINLSEQIVLLQQRAEQAEKAMLYAQAEFQTIRRRMEDQAAADRKYAAAELIKSLLPILDSFERALAAAEKTGNSESLVTGLRSIMKQMQSELEKAGVKPIESLGHEFDARLHEALGYTEDTDLPANTVAEEIQRGYYMHDRVLRPALVKVKAG